MALSTGSLKAAAGTQTVCELGVFECVKVLEFLLRTQGRAVTILCKPGVPR